MLTSNVFLDPEAIVARYRNETIVIVGTGPWWQPEKLGIKTRLNSNKWSDIDGGKAAAYALVNSRIQEVVKVLSSLPKRLASFGERPI